MDCCRRRESARGPVPGREVAPDGESIGAQEANGDAQAELAPGPARLPAAAPELLQHEGGRADPTAAVPRARQRRSAPGRAGSISLAPHRLRALSA